MLFLHDHEPNLLFFTNSFFQAKKILKFKRLEAHENIVLNAGTLDGIFFCGKIKKQKKACK